MPICGFAACFGIRTASLSRGLLPMLCSFLKLIVLFEFNWYQLLVFVNVVLLLISSVLPFGLKIVFFRDRRVGLPPRDLYCQSFSPRSAN